MLQRLVLCAALACALFAMRGKLVYQSVFVFVFSLSDLFALKRYVLVAMSLSMSFVIMCTCVYNLVQDSVDKSSLTSVRGF